MSGSSALRRLRRRTPAVARPQSSERECATASGESVEKKTLYAGHIGCRLVDTSERVEA